MSSSEFIRIEFSTNGGNSWTALASGVSPNASNYLWNTLGAADSTQALWRIVAQSMSNVWDVCNQVFIVRNAPPAPSGVQATDGLFLDRVQLTWNTVTNADGYDVYRAAVSNSASAARNRAVGVGDPIHRHHGSGGATYNYWVKAYEFNYVASQSVYSVFSACDPATRTRRRSRSDGNPDQRGGAPAGDARFLWLVRSGRQPGPGRD